MTPTFTMFVYERVTPSVKAGRRFPAERTADGEYRATVTGPVENADGVDLEVERRDGARAALWEAPLHRPILEADEVMFTTPERP